jgi:DNA-binding transcriptional LysR family regulator
MKVHEIRYALAVYRNLNFTQAATQCCVTTPALSRGLRKLEDELGAPLFVRDTHSVQITSFGKLMRPHLEQILNGMASARAAGKQFLDADKAPLRVGVMCTIGPARFLGFLGEFGLAHPHCQIRLADCRVNVLVAQLLDGSLDVAVMAFPDQADPRLKSHLLYRESFRIAVPIGHPFNDRESIPLAEAGREPHLLRESCEYKGYWLNEIQQLGMELPVAFRSEREDWIQAMVAGGFGVAFVPEFSPLMPGINLRPFSDHMIEREVSLVYVADIPLSPSAAEFARFAADWTWN